MLVAFTLYTVGVVWFRVWMNRHLTMEDLIQPGTEWFPFAWPVFVLAYLWEKFLYE